MLNKLRWQISDISVLTKRNLIRYIRLPQLIVFSSIQPVMFLLLFNYVFGGAIKLPGTFKYIDFVLPGMLVQTMLFGATQATVGLAEDLSTGMIERFRSLPMSRVAVVAGRILGDTTRNLFVVAILLIVGSLLGFRIHNGVGNLGLGIVITVLIGFAFCWISALLGLVVKNTEAAQVVGFIWIFPLVFASSVFVPTQTMPHWLQVFANHQPISAAVNAVRPLMMGGSAPLLPAFLWIIGITAIFMPLAVKAYKSLK